MSARIKIDKKQLQRWITSLCPAETRYGKLHLKANKIYYKKKTILHHAHIRLEWIGGPYWLHVNYFLEDTDVSKLICRMQKIPTRYSVGRWTQAQIGFHGAIGNEKYKLLQARLGDTVIGCGFQIHPLTDSWNSEIKEIFAQAFECGIHKNIIQYDRMFYKCKKMNKQHEYARGLDLFVCPFWHAIHGDKSFAWDCFTANQAFHKTIDFQRFKEFLDG